MAYKWRSRYRGVTWHTGAGKWMAKIKHDDRSVTVGYFDTELEAAVAWDRRALELRGRGGTKLNFPEKPRAAPVGPPQLYLGTEYDTVPVGTLALFPREGELPAGWDWCDYLVTDAAEFARRTHLAARKVS